ncbi:MAG: glycosyltransferase family 87 protein [Gemmataceae bacterium]
MTLTRGWSWALVGVLLIGAVLYHAKGVSLLFAENGGVDVHLRWQEQRYVMRGQNPYDVTHAALGVGRPPSDPSRNADPIPEVGVPDSGGYPPWAFLVGYLSFWPDWPAVKGYFLALSLVMTAVTGWWAYRVARPAGDDPHAGWLAAAAVLAISGCSTCVHVGQYGAVVVGLLALAAWALAAGKDWTAGVLLGIALLKPTIAGPFVLVPLVMGRWRAVAGCVGYVVAASAFVWWRTGTNPAEMLLQMLSAGADYVHDSQGLIGLLLNLGLTPKQVTPVLAAGVLVPGAAALWLGRRRPVDVGFAVAAVVGRLWAYHKGYDNMMLAFLVVALARVAFASRSVSAALTFLIVGATLWSPASLAKHEAFVLLQLAVWVGGVGVLLAAKSDRPALDPRR